MARPRSAGITADVLDAALELTAERGFSAVSMDAIAARAKVGKPAIYRRFDNKVEVVLAAIRRALTPMEAELPGGDVRAQLRALTQAAAPPDPEAYAALIGAVMAERRTHPELIAAFRREVLAPRRAVLVRVLECGQREGVVHDDLDPEVAVDMLGGAFLARVFAGGAVDQAWRDRLFATWWAAVRPRDDAPGGAPAP